MKNNAPVSLCPAQQRAYDWCLAALPAGNIFHCWSHTGRGRTTLLRQLHAKLGGALVTVQDFFLATQDRHPLALEDALFHVLQKALHDHDCVLVDDLHVSAAVMGGGCQYLSARSGLLDAPLTALARSWPKRKKLILGTDGSLAEPLRARAFAMGDRELRRRRLPASVRSLLAERRLTQLDFEKVHRFAPKLNAHQLKSACCWSGQFGGLETEPFIDYLRTQQLTSNVDLGEVSDVDLRDLKGVDDVIRSLEANIVLPLENDELAAELDLKPKRGVLLVGPPGHRQDDRRPGPGPPAQGQVLPDRRHVHLRARSISTA